MPFLRLLRPHHWIKNFFVFIPIFFAKEIFVWEKLESSLLAFAVFCLLASAVYVINDIVDREQDALHPKKKNRPIASGKVKVPAAIVLAILLLLVAALVIWKFIPIVVYAAAIYLGMNLAYSFA